MDDAPKWKVEVVDSSALAGGDCGIGVDSNNYAHITYHDYGKGAIKYAKFDGTSWKIQTVALNMGKQEGLRMAVDSQNTPHLVYPDSEKEKSTTTRKTGGLNLTLKGFLVFTAETQRTPREMFFSFPLRGRKAKILSPTGHDDTLFGDR